MGFPLILFFSFMFSLGNGLDKQELIEKANRLETKIDQVVEKLKDTHPGDAAILKDERVQLGLIVLNMEWADTTELAELESKLNLLEQKIEEQLTLIEEGKSITGIPKVTTHSTKPHFITTSKPMTTNGLLKTTSGQQSLNCEANTHFFDSLWNAINKLNERISELTQQHNTSEALKYVDKLHQIIDLQKQLDILVKQVNSLVDQVNSLSKITFNP